MSLAWGSLVLLVVLLPGVLFFVGLYMPEKFTRDAAERSAIGQLAAILAVSLAVHGLLFLLAPLYCRGPVPCVDLGLVLRTLAWDRPDPAVTSLLAANVGAHRTAIAVYLAVTAAEGIGVGYAFGRLAVSGRFQFLVQHRWVYELSVGDKLTTAWVMTHIIEGDRVLMYRGFLRGFHLKRDGTFSYVVLEHVRRGYLELKAEGPRASGDGKWPAIAPSSAREEQGQLQSHGQRYGTTLFAIEGEDIANIVFDRYEVAFNTSMRDTDFDRIADATLREFTNTRAAVGRGLPPRG